MDNKGKKNTVHPNSLANLKPIKKGEVRNPNGNGGNKRRKQLRELMLKAFTEDDVIEMLHVAKDVVIKDRNTKPLFEILDRMVGKPDTVGNEKADSKPPQLNQNIFNNLSRSELESVLSDFLPIVNIDDYQEETDQNKQS